LGVDVDVQVEGEQYPGGGDHAGRYRVHGDAPRGDVGGQRPGEAEHARLGRDVDDAAPALGAHVRHREPGHEVGAPEVDRDDEVEDLDRDLLDVLAVPALGGTGAVDEDVEPA